MIATRTRHLPLLAALLAPAPAGATGATGPETVDEPVFATVGETVLTLGDFVSALREGVRRRFYHGQIPEAEAARFQREVGERLIERTLLLQEARRRGIEPDAAWVGERLARYEQRLAAADVDPGERERIRAEIRARLEDESRVERLREAVRQVGEPTEAQLRRYYEQNPDRFTEPERFRVSAILLGVDPSAPRTAWEAARRRPGASSSGCAGARTSPSSRACTPPTAPPSGAGTWAISTAACSASPRRRRSTPSRWAR